MSRQGIHVIAEAGTNHNGDLAKAKSLVDIAGRSGADSVKFQIIYPWGLYLPGDYEYGHYDIKEVIRIREEGMLEDAEYEELAAYCREAGVPLSASVFDERGLELLMTFDPPYIKTASCDLNNVRFLRQVAEKGRKMVISTGMSTLADIENALKEVERSGLTDIVLLHCVSVYPARLEGANLSFIETLKEKFGYPVGYSDHTGDSLAACMALAKGATWFEKHYTEDRRQDGFDHAYAMEEDGLKAYVADLHHAEAALASCEIKLGEAELYTRKRARRSLYAARDLSSGSRVGDNDVLVVRPEGPMDADQIDLVVGRRLARDVKQYQPFTPEDLS